MLKELNGFVNIFKDIISFIRYANWKRRITLLLYLFIFYIYISLFLKFAQAEKLFNPLITILYLTSWIFIISLGFKNKKVMQFSLIMSGFTFFFSLVIVVYNKTNLDLLAFLLWLPMTPFNLGYDVLFPLFGLTDFNELNFTTVFLIAIIFLWFLISVIFFKRAKIIELIEEKNNY